MKLKKIFLGTALSAMAIVGLASCDNTTTPTTTEPLPAPSTEPQPTVKDDVTITNESETALKQYMVSYGNHKVLNASVKLDLSENPSGAFEAELKATVLPEEKQALLSIEGSLENENTAELNEVKYEAITITNFEYDLFINGSVEIPYFYGKYTTSEKFKDETSLTNDVKALFDLKTEETGEIKVVIDTEESATALIDLYQKASTNEKFIKSISEMLGGIEINLPTINFESETEIDAPIGEAEVEGKTEITIEEPVKSIEDETTDEENTETYDIDAILSQLPLDEIKTKALELYLKTGNQIITELLTSFEMDTLVSTNYYTMTSTLKDNNFKVEIKLDTDFITKLANFVVSQEKEATVEEVEETDNDALVIEPVGETTPVEKPTEEEIVDALSSLKLTISFDYSDAEDATIEFTESEDVYETNLLTLIQSLSGLFDLFYGEVDITNLLK